MKKSEYIYEIKIRDKDKKRMKALEEIMPLILNFLGYRLEKRKSNFSK